MLLFILPNFLGLNGVWIATPVSDGLAILITIIVLMKEFKKDEILVEVEQKLC
ncbi:hypothetical protein [Clostridium sp.]